MLIEIIFPVLYVPLFVVEEINDTVGAVLSEPADRYPVPPTPTTLTGIVASYYLVELVPSAPPFLLEPHEYILPLSSIAVV